MAKTYKKYYIKLKKAKIVPEKINQDLKLPIEQLLKR
jgi:hypothetical protein